MFALAFQQLGIHLAGVVGVVDDLEDGHHCVRQFLIDGRVGSFLLFHSAPFLSVVRSYALILIYHVS